MLIKPTFKAALACSASRIVLAGGVAANSRLREKMTEKANAEGLKVYFPSPKFCTDKGAMIALTGYHALKRGRRDDFRLKADADLTLRILGPEIAVLRVLHVMAKLYDNI